MPAWTPGARCRRSESLITNAVRHTPAGSPLWVLLRRHDDGALVGVDDAGAGVPAEIRQVIFERFRRAPGAPPAGLGIGLSLVARMAELHGGRAWVTDRPGGGAAFRVLWQMSAADARSRISLLICDDHRVLTDAMATVVGTDASLVLVADPVDNANDAIALAATHNPDVVLMDIELGAGMNGIEATRRIKAVSPRTNVVILSGHRRRTVLVEAVEAGACGFLDKSEAVGDVLAVVRRAAAGDMIIDPRLLASLMTELAAERHVRQQASAVLSRLTRREQEVLQLLSTGLGNDGIAERLFISAATARTHVQNILTKLGAHSKLEAVAIAARAGQAKSEAPT